MIALHNGSHRREESEPLKLEHELRVKLEELRHVEFQAALEAAVRSTPSEEVRPEPTLDDPVTRRHVHAIQDIDEALARIDAGHFGVCIECGESIGTRRLLDFPTTQRCATCQEMYDHAFRHAHPTH
ncbi:MAG TPA: TraR/DksA family transcriptional regulator [Casimicrobiaceae bacterium]|nr:TraR/DksA family transcriptional regulator [Casimicrobiaceae bacterium]